MKKLILSLALLMSIPAFAQHHGYHGYHGHRHGGGWGWAPWVGGAIAGAVIYDIYNRPVVVQQQPVIVQPQQPTVVYQPQSNCSPWTEIQNSDGTITRSRTCTQ